MKSLCLTKQIRRFFIIYITHPKLHTHKDIAIHTYNSDRIHISKIYPIALAQENHTKTHCNIMYCIISFMKLLLIKRSERYTGNLEYKYTEIWKYKIENYMERHPI